MKNMKVHTKLVIGFVVTGILNIIAIWQSYVAINKIASVSDPQIYMKAYNTFLLILLCVSAVTITSLSVWIAGVLRRSLKQLSEAAQQIALGKVEIHLEKQRDDEFGHLIDEYQQVIDNTRRQAKIAEEVADGNLTIEVVPRSPEDLLGISLKKLVDRNFNALTNISDASEQVMTGASQVASASEALAQGSTEQASALEQITASIGEIAEKTRDNADQANEAAELVSQAISDVKKGNAQMQDMMAAMQDINKASESISKIIKTIDDIAFQTNILALNAAVEAARAGEAGKGFAVVAEEVRNLAAKSASAASETAELIEDSINKVAAGSQIADDTAKALETITKAVEQSETLINGIADASNYQATAVAQIDQALGQVSQVVQTNSATSEECAAASVELSNQANRVRDLLAIYNLGNGAAAANRMMEGMETSAVSGNTNEQLISLGDGYRKY